MGIQEIEINYILTQKSCVAAWLRLSHYENMPLQYTEIFKVVKMKMFAIFLIFAQNIDCGYTLDGSNEYP